MTNAQVSRIMELALMFAVASANEHRCGTFCQHRDPRKLRGLARRRLVQALKRA
jgi:hypothetical protein